MIVSRKDWRRPENRPSNAGGRKRECCVGIHFGEDAIVAAVYQTEPAEIKWEYVFTKILISPVGEVLVGEREKRYLDCHRDAQVISAPLVQLLEEEQGDIEAGIPWKGHGISIKRIAAALLQELRRKLSAISAEAGRLRECVVSCSSSSPACRNAIERLFAESGFEVKRIINSAEACAQAGYQEPRDGRKESSLLFFAAERKRVSVSLVYNGEDVQEVIYTKVYPCDPATCGSLSQLWENIYQRQFGEYRLDLNPVPDTDLDTMRKCWREDRESGKIRIYAAPDFCCGLGRESETAGLDCMEIFAAQGAAMYCAYISGMLRPGKRVDLNTAFGPMTLQGSLLLRVTLCRYGAELLDADGRTVRELDWLLEPQTTIPARTKKKEHDYWQIPRETEKLRICMEPEGTHRREYRELNREQLCGEDGVLPEKLEIWFDVDANSEVRIYLSNPADGKEKHFRLFPSCKANVQTWWAKREDEEIAAGTMPWKIRAKISEFCAEAERVRQNRGQAGSPATLTGLEKIIKLSRVLLHKCGTEISGRSRIVGTVHGTAGADGVWAAGVDGGQSLSDLQLLDGFLAIVDCLEYAARQIGTGTGDAVEAFLVRNYLEFQDYLREELSVRPVPAEGEFFDPNLHYALMKETCPGLPEGAVLEELQSGFFFQGRLLRPAKVKVCG